MDFFTNPNIIFYILAYLVGSIPFGLLLAKKYAGVNVQESGSKSIGATNVLRVVKETNPSLAKKLGIATVLLDAIKGVVVILVAMAYGMSMETLWAIAVISVLGHCYSVYLSFEGGKGVATGLGVFLVLIPIPTIIGALVWGFCAKVLKISSISSLLGLIGVVISAIIFNNGLGIDSNAPMYIITFIIFYKHIPNIVRLVKGEEVKLLNSSTTMKVSIDSLTFKTIIGILPFERVTKQKVILDISFAYNFTKGQKDFIDYSHVANMAKMIMKKEKFLLIEDAIIYLDRALTKEFKIKKLKVKITKPDILKNCTVSVAN